MKKTSLILILLVFTFILSCRDENRLQWSKEPWPSEATIFITLINNSTTDTHMWSNNENIGPGNKLAPGNQRLSAFKVTFDKEDDTEYIIICAGRNGQTIDTYNIALSFNKDKDVYTYTASFTTSEKITITSSSK